MNYEPNTTRWRRGSVVIHDADAKEPRFLMLVTGYSRDKSLCRTQYIDCRERRTVWRNEFQFLHDPTRFGLYPEWAASQITLNRMQYEWEHVQRFNRFIEPGSFVKTTSADGGFDAVVAAPAFLQRSGTGAVTLRVGGKRVLWALEFVQAGKMLQPLVEGKTL